MTDPVVAILEDRASAREAGDRNADLCWLATIDETGAPRVRTLVLRELAGDLALFVNASSPKWHHLGAGARVELAAWYPTLARQWRISAALRELDRETLALHWQQRPHTAKVLDHVYDSGIAQSSVVDDHDSVVQAHGALAASLTDQPPTASSARGLILEPLSIERLQIRPADALHERQRWSLRDGRWRHETLMP